MNKGWDRETEKQRKGEEKCERHSTKNADKIMNSEAMQSLEDGLSNLEKGARDFYNSTRENMVKGAVKTKFSKFF